MYVLAWVCVRACVTVNVPVYVSESKSEGPNMIYSFGHHVLRCWTMSYEVWFLSNIVKTFLLFPSLMNNIWFVSTACKTLLDSRTRTRLRLILIWAISVPESLPSIMFYKTCFTLFGLVWPPRKTSPNIVLQMMFFDALLVWTGLKRLDESLLVHLREQRKRGSK